MLRCRRMNKFSLEIDDTLPSCFGSAISTTEVAGTTSTFTALKDPGFEKVRAGFAIALHMHQPLIPAGGSSNRVISNLQFMQEHPEMPDAHNASAFLSCYRRMGDFIPQLVAEGKSPRVMLDYSGCLLHGLQQMGITM